MVKLSNEDTAEIESLRDVAMATNFGTKIAITGGDWLWRGLVVGRQYAGTADTPQLREVAMATNFWLSMGYK